MNLKAKVIKVENDFIVINVGSNDGVHTGDKVKIIDDETVLNVENEVINVYKYKKELEVTQVHEAYCIVQKVKWNTEIGGFTMSMMNNLNSLVKSSAQIEPINSKTDENSRVSNLLEYTNSIIEEQDFCIVETD